MVQFKILSGKKAGTVWVARRFPVRVGRASQADLAVDDAGVWDDHFQVGFRRGEGYFLSVHPEARVAINHELIQEALLRNGDLIEAGALKLQFWLGEVRQGSLAVREFLTWLLVAGVTLGQIALIYWVLE